MKTATFTPQAAAAVAQMVAEAEARMARYSEVFGGFPDEDMAAQFAAVKSAKSAMQFATEGGAA